MRAKGVFQRINRMAGLQELMMQVFALAYKSRCDRYENII